MKHTVGQTFSVIKFKKIIQKSMRFTLDELNYRDVNLEEGCCILKRAVRQPMDSRSGLTHSTHANSCTCSVGG